MFLRKRKEVKEKNIKKTKSSKQERRERRNVQNAIHYDMMMKNGTCSLGNDLYSKTIRLQDINYQIAMEEDQMNIYSKYMENLNALGQENGIQLTVHNKKIDAEEFEKEIFMKEKEDGFDSYRNEFNQVVKRKLKNGNKIISEKLLTFTVKEDSYEEGDKALKLLENEFRNKFSEMQCEIESMKGYDRLETIYSMWNPDKKFFFNYDQLNDTFTTKDAIAPDMLNFQASSQWFQINDRYAKVLYLKNWSTELSDQLIQSLTRIEHNITISFHMKAIPRGDDIALVKRQIAKMEAQTMEEQRKAIDKGYNPEMIPMDLKYSYTEGQILRDDVEQRNQRLFECQFLIMINANSKEELDDIQKQVETTCKKMSCEVGVLSYRQEEAMNAVIPLGINMKYLARTLTTSVCAIMIPFTSQELMEKGTNSVYYGLNAITNNLIVANRTLLGNPSGWIFGKPGFGKSFAAKKELSWVWLNSKDDIVAIDPQNEFSKLGKTFYGSTIHVDTKNNVHLNPFDGDMRDHNFVKTKAEFAQILMAEIVGGGLLDAEQKGIIDVSIRLMYDEYQQKILRGEEVEMPTLDDFQKILENREEKKSKTMALALSPYVTGGTYDLFSGQNNQDIHNRLTIYNILELPETMRTLAMKVILETLRMKILYNFKKRIRTWVYIDEIYLLLKDEYSSNFLYEFFKWARKFGAIITGITQNVEDLLNSPKARTMLSNSEFLILLNQAASDREELASLLNLSNEQSRCISNSKKGSGLIKFGNAIIPFMDEFEKDTKLYSLWNTNFNEIKHENDSMFKYE